MKLWTIIYKAICITAALLLCGVVLKYALWVFVCDKFRIPTSSMYPTLQEGDQVLVNKCLMGARIYTDFHFAPDGIELQSFRTKGLRSPQYNDIAVFNLPHHQGKLNFVINHVYCKRIVALPGDSLSISNGFYRNNNFEGTLGIESEQHRLSETPDSLLYPIGFVTQPFGVPLVWTIKEMGPMYIPRAGDLVTITPKEAALYRLPLEWELGKVITFDWQQGTVYADGAPLTRHRFLHDYYFMAGDNVINSNDSRYWGLVPEEYIVGIVDYIYRKEGDRWLKL